MARLVQKTPVLGPYLIEHELNEKQQEYRASNGPIGAAIVGAMFSTAVPAPAIAADACARSFDNS
jgi:hypothetical protein